MTKIKKVPIRTCIVCRQPREKQELLRVVKTKDGEVFVDTSGKQNGRGAYICKDVECINKAKKIGALKRALGIDIDDGVYVDLISEVSP